MGRKGDLLVTELVQQEKDGHLEGVTFTEEDWEHVRQWVQDRSQSGEIVATPARLYLPVYGYMTTLDPGDTVWFDTEAEKPDAFTVERA